MPFIDTKLLQTGERLPGWKGRLFSTETMTFAHYVFDAGSKIHEHCHLNEEVWTVLEGELEVSVGSELLVAGPGCIAVVPPWAAHSVRAITDGKAIVTDCPVRTDFGGTGRAVVQIRFDHPVALGVQGSERGSHHGSGNGAAGNTAESGIAKEADAPGKVTSSAIEIPFTLHNWGKSRAIVRKLSIESGIGPALPAPTTTAIPDGELPVYCVLDADGRYSGRISHQAPAKSEPGELLDDGSVFYVKGVVIYEDDSGSRQHSTFCRVYDGGAFDGKGGFITPDKRGYNYGS